MEHAVCVSVKELLHIGMTIKSEVKEPATSTRSQNIDIERDVNHTNLEQGSVRSVKSEPAFWVKEEILEDDSHDGNEQLSIQGTLTPADAGSGNEACGTSEGALLHVKQELEEIDIGPTVLQHMDIHYIMSKNRSALIEDNTIVDDGTEAMPGGGVKKESAEDKLIASHGQNMTENDYHKAQISFRQQNLPQHRLRQQRITRSTDFKCDTRIHKPLLHCAHNKVIQGNRRKNFMMTSSIDSPLPNRNREKKTKTKQKPYVCDKEYISKAAKFAQSRLGEKPYSCNTCDKSYKTCGQLTVHMRVHTGEKPYCCDTCDKQFKQRCELTAHMRVHTVKKPYWCDTCDKRFKQHSRLIVHLRVHTGEKAYRCDTCDKRFKRRWQVSDHMGVHTTEKSFRCNTCDKRFKRRSHLTEHMTVHTGEKRYWCDTCDKGFKRRSHLTVHMKVHTGKKLYPCDKCDAKFKRGNEFTHHMDVSHNTTGVTRVIKDVN